MKGILVFFWFTVVVTAGLQAQRSDFANTDFRKADSIAALYSGHSVSDLYSLSLKLTSALRTDQEKFRSIYKWVSENIENDYSLYYKNQRQREKLKDDPAALAKWNREMTQIVFETLRTKHKTVCTGYAYLLRELSAHAGISCPIIDGYGRNAIANIGGTGRPNHSWNAVRLQDKWYLCDATWSSGAIDLGKKSFVRQYDDSYFLLEPELFVRNHYPLDSTWILLDQRPTLEEFLNGPLIYASAFDFGIVEFYPDAFNVSVKKKAIITLRFKKKGGESIETVALHISGPAGASIVAPSIDESVSGYCTIGHAFGSKGIHVVQVMLNGRFVFCYRVDVN